MRHRRDNRKLGRTVAHRRAMFRNMVNSLITHEAVTTTDAKAKELRRHADRMITLGKRGLSQDRVPVATLKRRAYDELRSRTSVTKLFDTLAPRFAGRQGGYTRLIKLGFREGDNAPLTRVEFVEEQAAAPAKKKKPAKSAKAKTSGKPSTKKESKPQAEDAKETASDAAAEVEAEAKE